MNPACTFLRARSLKILMKYQDLRNPVRPAKLSRHGSSGSWQLRDWL